MESWRLRYKPRPKQACLDRVLGGQGVHVILQGSQLGLVMDRGHSQTHGIRLLRYAECHIQQVKDQPCMLASIRALPLVRLEEGQCSNGMPLPPHPVMSMPSSL